MAKVKVPSVQKSVRIPTDVMAEIEKEAKEDFGGNVSDDIVFRLRHFKAPLTPVIKVKVQNLVNKAVDTVKNIDPSKVDEMQKEVDDLWKYLR